MQVAWGLASKAREAVWKSPLGMGAMPHAVQKASSERAVMYIKKRAEGYSGSLGGGCPEKRI